MDRFHELDALRAFAMLLGIVLHAGLFFVSWGFVVPGQASRAIETSEWIYALLFALVHGFRMPVFFLLSGFFTAMLWERRGLRALVKHRLMRIGVPLALGAVTIVPANAWLFTGEGFNPIYWPFAWLAGFHHLWFLGMLLLLGAVFVLAARFGLRFERRGWWALAPLSAICMFFMGEAVIGPDTSEGLSPDPTVLLFYACFFFFGTHVRQRGIAISKSCAYLTLPALTVVFGTALLVLYPDGKPVEPGGPAWAIGAACQAAFAWLMCFGTMGLFRLIVSKERLWVRYVADSSYWLYLWHLPLLIALQYPLSRMDIDPHLNFLILCLLATAILLATYQFVVRYTLIGTLLNGKRTRRRSPANAGPIAAGSIRT